MQGTDVAAHMSNYAYDCVLKMLRSTQVVLYK